MHPWERDETRVFFEGGAGGAIDTLKGLPPPKDLAAFWQKQRARLAAVPVRAERRPLKSPNESVALWAVEIACAGLGDYICPPSGLAVFYNNLTCPREIRWMQGSTLSYLPYHARSWMRISRKCAHGDGWQVSSLRISRKCAHRR